MTRHLRRLWRIVAGFFAVALLMVIGAALLAAHWRHIPLGASTTRIAGPLAKDGLPDYLAAINEEYGKGVTATNNAAPAVLAVVGMDGEPAKWVASETRLLGMKDPGKGAFVAYGEWQAQHGQPATQGDASSDLMADVRTELQDAWRREEHPEIAAYLEAQKGALDAVEAAAGRERFFMPMVTEDGSAVTLSRPAVMEVHFIETNRLKAVSVALGARALERLGEGDQEGFVRDATSLMKLGELLAQQPSLVQYFVGNGVRGLGALAVEKGAAMPTLQEGIVRELAQEVGREGEWPMPTGQLGQWERYWLLDGICASAEGYSGAPGSSGGVHVVPVDFPKATEQVNAFFDRCCDDLMLAHYQERADALEALGRAVDNYGRGGLTYRLTHSEALFVEMIPAGAFTSMNRWPTTTMADDRLMAAALALRLFRLQHGMFPETLAEAGITGRTATDPFVDRPLIYHRRGTGYIVYSVGQDLVDDGGKRPPKNAGPKGWDQVVETNQ